MKEKETTATTATRVEKSFKGNISNVNVSKGRIILTLDCKVAKCTETGEEEETNVFNVSAKKALVSTNLRLAKSIALKLDDFNNDVQLNPSLASIFIGANIEGTRQKYLAGEKNPNTMETLTRNIYHTSQLIISGITEKDLKDAISDIKLLGENVTIRTISDVELIRM